MDVNRRTEIACSLYDLLKLLRTCDDYLEIYIVWDKARRSMDDFMDNPDWLEKWVNEPTEKVEVRP